MSEALAPDLDSYYDGFIAPLAAEGRPVFLASCKLPFAKAVLFFPMGEKNGKYAEFSENGSQVNGAAVRLSDRVSVDDLMGGIAVRAAAMATINGLVKSRFELILPGDLRKAWTSRPAIDCAAN